MLGECTRGNLKAAGKMEVPFRSRLARAPVPISDDHGEMRVLPLAPRRKAKKSDEIDLTIAYTAGAILLLMIGLVACSIVRPRNPVHSRKSDSGSDRQAESLAPK